MKTERIDFQTLSDGKVIVNKMHRDGGRDVVHSHEIKPAGFDLDAALRWCDENGYAVFRWRDEHGRQCARAFLDKPWPIRTTREIIQKRAELEAIWLKHFRTPEGAHVRHPIEQLLALDLAYAG